MMKMYNPNMGRGMDTVHAVLNVHVCTNVNLEFLPQSNGHLLMTLLGSPLLLHHLGHHIWLGCTWNVAAVENLWGPAMVLCRKVMDCQLERCSHHQKN